ncbi:hypothetical protein M758_3G180600 [Ceratodon purpureus]|uniref:Uncharacterized protein n=1 Tax=Ceratodon purpureus TaxID=3225 RepID=A0A8T0IM75_CERPU|nr:hypothetical protein KC19_3G179800 [Ceratodon purpureus]KAG0623524.1 hypothetical protein M758_3G180600 [Ceratodon purpureus]
MKVPRRLTLIHEAMLPSLETWGTSTLKLHRCGGESQSYRAGPVEQAACDRTVKRAGRVVGTLPIQ